MFGGFRLGVFEIVVCLVIALGALTAAGAQDFGNHIIAQRIGISHTDAPSEMHEALRAARM